MTRCYQAALGVSLDELMGDRTSAKEKYFKTTHGNIRIFDDAAIYRRQIEDLCNRYKPGLVVIDQLDKIKGLTEIVTTLNSEQFINGLENLQSNIAQLSQYLKPTDKEKGLSG